MGSSAKKKKDKRKDFQKPKLRIGKTKTKPDNFTDTSFTAKSIVVNQQSLTIDAPSLTSQFTHYLSLASTSKSDTQRRDALAFLTTALTSLHANATPPIATAIVISKLLPLTLDGSSSVRTHLLKLLRLLPSREVTDHAESALLYVRAGMTHLAAAIRNDALSTLEWLLESGKVAVVACPGGWVKTLNAFMSMMGWAVSSGTVKWTSAARTSFGKGGKAFPRQLAVLSKFLKLGLDLIEPEEPFRRGKLCPLWDTEVHMIPFQSNAYSHLNLFGPERDEEGEIYSERESRQRVFSQRFYSLVRNGVESSKKEGGEVGRAAAALEKTLLESMSDYELVAVADLT